MKKLLLLSIFPFGLMAQPVHSVTLNWAWSQGTGGAATGFIIQRGTVHGGPYTQIGTVGSPTTLTYIDTSAIGNILAEGTTFYYVVLATNATGNSAPSNEALAAIPITLPASPTGLTATVH